MAAIRRGYTYLACAITLQAVAWAVISLLRDLLPPDREAPPEIMAFQIAVIVVALPTYAAHWLWVERLVRRGDEERGAALRHLYLYGMLAAFAAPLAANVFGLAKALFDLGLRTRVDAPAGVEFDPVLGFDVPVGASAGAVVDPVVGAAVLAMLWLYHWRVTRRDAGFVADSAIAATLRRLYVMAFSLAGLVATTGGAVTLIRRSLPPFDSPGTASALAVAPITAGLTFAMAQAVVGAGLWALFWAWAQRLFRGPDDAERRSALRKLYLYGVVSVAVLLVVTHAAFLLAGALRAALRLAAEGDARDALAVIVGLGVVWAYHARVLQWDAAVAGEAPRQASIRRLYHYLVAAIGLAAGLIGLGGVVSVLIRAAVAGIADEALRNQLAWFTATLVTGLPVWALPWRRVQALATAPGDAGADERRAISRKIYLYLNLLGTGVTVLVSAIYLVYRLVSRLFGVADPGDDLGTDLAQALAFALIGGGAWVYHALLLRRDDRLNREADSGHLATLRVLVAGGEGSPAPALAVALRRALPGLGVDAFSPAAAGEASEGGAPAGTMIVAPWDIAAHDPAIAASPHPKLLLPTRAAGRSWAGVDPWTDEALVEQAVFAVRQWAAGEPIRAERPLGVGAALGIALAVVVVLGVVGIPVMVVLGMIMGG